MMLIEKLTLKMASLTNVLDWLTQPQGPHLVDGTSTENPLTALAILITPEALYDPDSPMVGLGLVYVVRRRGRLAPCQPLSVCALLPA